MDTSDWFSCLVPVATVQFIVLQVGRGSCLVRGMQDLWGCILECLLQRPSAYNNDHGLWLAQVAAQLQGTFRIYSMTEFGGLTYRCSQTVAKRGSS